MNSVGRRIGSKSVAGFGMHEGYRSGWRLTRRRRSILELVAIRRLTMASRKIIPDADLSYYLVLPRHLAGIALEDGRATYRMLLTYITSFVPPCSENKTTRRFITAKVRALRRKRRPLQP